jgi:hypothetical protein
MGAQTSFFSSEGAPFDVLSEASGAFPPQSEALESIVTGDETMILYHDLFQKGNQWNGANQVKHRRERTMSLSPP